MAKFNESLVGRFNRFLQRFLSMKGGPPSAQLSTEIASQIELDNAGWLENRFPMGWRSYGGFAIGAAAVGQTSAVFLRNPTTSGIIAVIEKLTIVMGAAASTPILSRSIGPTNQTAVVG